jgi:hypothetical protein
MADSISQLLSLAAGNELALAFAGVAGLFGLYWLLSSIRYVIHLRGTRCARAPGPPSPGGTRVAVATLAIAQRSPGLSGQP